MSRNKSMNNKPIESQIEKYLGENPAIEESLKIFNISMENYKSAVKSLTEQKVQISTTSTTINNG